MRSRVTRSSRERFIVNCSTPTSPKPALQPPAAAELAGHSQSFGRVLTIVGGDCALLEREGGLALLSLTVAELAAPVQ